MLFNIGFRSRHVFDGGPSYADDAGPFPPVLPPSARPWSVPVCSLCERLCCLMFDPDDVLSFELLRGPGRFDM